MLKSPLADLLRADAAGKIFPRVVKWTLLDARRITLVPPGHWLLLEDPAPFRATLEMQPHMRFTFNPSPLATAISRVFRRANLRRKPN